MVTSARYFDLVREMKNAYNHRLRLVESAQQRGIKPTARLFQTTVPTVRKWLRRYQQQGPRGLIELSRAPHLQPGKTALALEQQVVALRQQLPTFGARRLIREFDLPLSHRALERIWRQHGLLRKRQRKYQRKQDLAHIKAHLARLAADFRRHQRPRRHPALLAPGTGFRSSHRAIHRPRRALGTAVLGLRPAPLRFRQRRLRRPHPATSRALRRLAS